MKIAQTNVLEIAATVSSEQVTFIKEGQEVTFTVATGAPVQTGRIVRINPVADANTRQFTVFIQVQNADGAVKAGQFAQGNIVLNHVAQAMVVPETAIKQAEGQAFVYVVSQGKLTKRPVKVLLQDPTTSRAAVEGLRAGEAVLRTELLGIKEGDAVSLPQAGK